MSKTLQDKNLYIRFANSSFLLYILDYALKLDLSLNFANWPFDGSL